MNDWEKLNIKNAELKLCVRSYHAFHAQQNDGLINLYGNNWWILLESTIGLMLRIFYLAETPYLHFAKKGCKNMKVFETCFSSVVPNLYGCVPPFAHFGTFHSSPMKTFISPLFGFVG